MFPIFCCCFCSCSLPSPVLPFFQPISISPTQCHHVMPVFEYNAMQKSYVKLIVFKLDFKLKLFCFLFFVFYNSLTYTQLKWGLYETLPKFEILGSVYVQVFPVSQASHCSKYCFRFFFLHTLECMYRQTTSLLWLSRHSGVTVSCGPTVQTF